MTRYALSLILALSAISALGADQTEVIMTDPTQPPASFGIVEDNSPATTYSDSDIKLSAIIFSNNRKIAIINNQPLTTGDKINGMTLLNVEKETVLLETQNGVITLPLVRADIKKPAATLNKTEQK